MFFKTFHILFLAMLMFGTLTAVSANTWFTAWLGLEINLMSMIPLILIKLVSNFSESAIKYFLTQAMASIIMIFTVTVGFFNTETLSMEILELMMIVSLAIKMGAAPFHTWFPQVAANLNWTQNILLFTWQKIAPFMLLSTLSNSMLIVLGVLSALVGALSGFNQLSMKLILTYSSISHSGWMINACMFNMNYWLLYFLIYSTLSIAIILFFSTNQIFKMNQVFSANDTYTNKFILVMNMLSLGGLPPLLGFSAKLSVILLMINYLNFMVFLILILSSLISLYFYSRSLYSSMMNFTQKFKVQSSNKNMMSTFYFLTIFFNLFAPVMFLLT